VRIGRQIVGAFQQIDLEIAVGMISDQFIVIDVNITRTWD